MKNLIKKVSSNNSDIISQIKVGSRVFSLVKTGNTLRGILDGSEILASAAEDCFIDKLPRIVSSITEDLLGGENKGISFKLNKKDPISDRILDSMISEMAKKNIPIKTKNMRNFEPVCSLYSLKDPIEYDSVISKVPSLLNVLRNITQILEISLNDSMVLTKRKLVDSMWGADKTQRVIDSIRKELMKLAPESDKLNLYFELIRKSVERLKVFHRRSDVDSLKVMNNILIPNIICNFDNVKRFSSDLFFAMSPLLHIDELFLKNTSYPSSFFLPIETLEAIEDDYKLIIEFLNKVPNIEQEILNPLDLLRYNSKKIR